MKRILIVLVLACLVFASDMQVGKIVTVNAGTLQRVANTRTLVNSIFIQMQHGGTGYGLVYSTDPSVACNTNNLVAELAPATSTAPGGSYSFPSNGIATDQSSGYDVNWICVDGSHTGDGILVSYNPR